MRTKCKMVPSRCLVFLDCGLKQLMDTLKMFSCQKAAISLFITNLLFHIEEIQLHTICSKICGHPVVWSFVPRFGLDLLVPTKWNLNAAAYNDILDNSVPPALHQQFVFVSFLFLCDNALVHKERLLPVWPQPSPAPLGSTGLQWVYYDIF